MTKKEILKKSLNILYKSDLIFSKKDLYKNLVKENINLTDSTFDHLLADLVKNYYLIQEDGNLIKSERILKNENNKQTAYLKYLYDEYSQDFDEEYIKLEYIDKIKSTEEKSSKEVDIISNSFRIIKQYLSSMEKTKNIENSFEM